MAGEDHPGRAWGPGNILFLDMSALKLFFSIHVEDPSAFLRVSYTCNL